VTPATERRRAKAAARGKTRGSLKGEVYRQARLWHGWLSALAFIALMFFSATGLLLNHPEWFRTESQPRPTEVKLTLSADELAKARSAKDPGRAIAEIVGRKTRLLGAYQSGEVIDGEAQLRTEGVNGSSDILADMETGKAEISTERARLVTTLNDLHRGKNAGAAWKLIIDASAVVVLALSLIGYVLFFSLRFRLRTGLILTGISLAALLAVFFLLAP
jgi:hypothetical protein